MDRSNPHIAQPLKLTPSEIFPIFSSSNPSTFSHNHVTTYITDKINGLVHISRRPRSEESTRQLEGSLSTITFTTKSVASVIGNAASVWYYNCNSKGCSVRNDIKTKLLIEFSPLDALAKQERKATVRIFMYAHDLPFRMEERDSCYEHNWTELIAASNEYP